MSQKDLKEIPVCLILGASSGLGLELAKQYSLKKGYKVVIAARREDLLKKETELIQKKGGDIEYCKTDATDQEQVKKLAEFTIKKFKRIDVAIYCAGISLHSLFEKITNIEKVTRIIMDVNFTGLVYFTYYVREHLKKSTGYLCGISSIVGEISPSYTSLYSAAKHAMNGFLESLANEEPGFSVTICIPGYLDTEFGEKKIVGDGEQKNLNLKVDESKKSTYRQSCRICNYRN